MNRFRLHYSLSRALLLAIVLLAAQSMLLWHTHDAEHASESTCELCVHAQQHTPAPPINPPLVFAAFSVVGVHQPVIHVVPAVNFRFTYASRAPPYSLFS